MRQDFKLIPGTDGYLVNTEGVILTSEGRRISTYIASLYEVCKLRMSDKTRRTQLVHRAVWKAHRGDIPKTVWVAHKDGDKLNNKLENLEAGSPSHNHAHARDVLQRNYASGEQVPTSQLSKEAVEAILLLHNLGMSQHKLSKIFLVSQPAISNIINKKAWK